VSALPAAEAAGPRPETPGDERLRGALTGLGFKPAEADRAVSALHGRVGVASFEELLREALALLAK
jgi:Holliday junction DNA helicase RuvA